MIHPEPLELQVADNGDGLSDVTKALVLFSSSKSGHASDSRTTPGLFYLYHAPYGLVTPSFFFLFFLFNFFYVPFPESINSYTVPYRSRPHYHRCCL